jgi:hypothetical protein
MPWTPSVGPPSPGAPQCLFGRRIEQIRPPQTWSGCAAQFHYTAKNSGPPSHMRARLQLQRSSVTVAIIRNLKLGLLWPADYTTAHGRPTPINLKESSPDLGPLCTVASGGASFNEWPGASESALPCPFFAKHFSLLRIARHGTRPAAYLGLTETGPKVRPSRRTGICSLAASDLPSLHHGRIAVRLARMLGAGAGGPGLRHSRAGRLSAAAHAAHAAEQARPCQCAY